MSREEALERQVDDLQYTIRELRRDLERQTEETRTAENHRWEAQSTIDRELTPRLAQEDRSYDAWVTDPFRGADPEIIQEMQSEAWVECLHRFVKLFEELQDAKLPVGVREAFDELDTSNPYEVS